MKIKKKVSRLVTTISDKITSNNGLSQELTKAEGERYMTEGIGEVIREAAAEGAVLLKNDGVLPFTDKDKVSVFGRCQYNYFTVGYGSGGDVHPAYKVNLLSALRNSTVKINEQLASYYEAWCNIEDNVPDDGFWGHWPMCYSEMPLTREMVTYSSVVSNCALVVIGRAAGEDRENKLKKGSYYLTDIEKKNLDLICDAFERVVIVMDCGNIIDMAWTEEYGDKIKAVLWAWQGGQESGNAVADVLSGRVCPSGKLAETYPLSLLDTPCFDNFSGAIRSVEYRESVYIGYRYYDSAEKEVLFPFGYGLSYTEFKYSGLKLSKKKMKDTDTLTVSFKVKNTGKVAGAEVAQVYVADKESTIFRPKKELKGFVKVYLEPGEEKTVSVELSKRAFAYYNVNIGDWHVESGEFDILVGASSRDIRLEKTVDVESTVEAEIPDYRETAPAYYTVDMKNIPDSQFEAVLGHEIPEATFAPGAKLDLTCSLENATNSKWGKRINALIEKVMDLNFTAGGASSGMMKAMILQIPIRNFISMSGGVFTEEMADGLLMILNGESAGKGLGKILKGLAGAIAKIPALLKSI